MLLLSSHMQNRFLKITKYSLLVIGLLIVSFCIWLYSLHQDISEQIESGWFNPPVELYSQAERIFIGEELGLQKFTRWMQSWGYKQAEKDLRLLSAQYRQLDADECAQRVSNYDFDGLYVSSCVEFRTQPLRALPFSDNMNLVAFDDKGVIRALFIGEPLISVEELRLPPQLYAQFYNSQPILRSIIPLGQIPLQCLQAVTAIEDKNFLIHQGVSWTGMMRAALRNVLAGGYSQGGSTITQQLVKNYFLTPEKTLRRKFVELFMALMLESQVSKDKILESYLNIIYMGQNGPFQVIGIQAASDYYFNKNVKDLKLNECALLAAIINNPGRYNPFRKEEAAKKRRQLVLEKMLEVGFIDKNSEQAAANTSLPSKPIERLSEPAPYYTQAVFRELSENNIDISKGLKVYTYLNESAQEAAQKRVLSHAEDLEKRFKSLQKKKAEGHELQAALISVDIETAGINSLVGGRKYIRTQFNRILDANRQVGSIMKPFVYLAALEARTPEGESYTPNSILSDEKFTYKYEGQSWSPQNYDKKFRGEVPMYYALSNSLNIPTVKLGLEVGLSNIIDVARRAGITADLQELPSLTLGAFEITPIQVAQSYLPIARMGTSIKLHTINQVENLEGELIYEQVRDMQQEFSPHTTADLVSMMKETINSGTAASSKLYGFDYQAAGKTGTTSDTKDAWFAGFTPQILTITWVGYDDNTPTGLTGASGALPLWIYFMKDQMKSYPAKDFNWPEGYEQPAFIPVNE